MLSCLEEPGFGGVRPGTSLVSTGSAFRLGGSGGGRRSPVGQLSSCLLSSSFLSFFSFLTSGTVCVFSFFSFFSFLTLTSGTVFFFLFLLFLHFRTARRRSCQRWSAQVTVYRVVKGPALILAQKFFHGFQGSGTAHGCRSTQKPSQWRQLQWRCLRKKPETSKTSFSHDTHPAKNF